MLKIKVCGMRESQNILALAELQPDLMGFIFYSKSARFTGEVLEKEILKSLPGSIQKTGVFVNESYEKVIAISKEYGLDFVQLHGKETVEFCEKLKKEGLKIIKVFSVDNSFDFTETINFEDFADYFLFDTKAEGGYGGHGKAFDWNILDKYEGNTPFLLAGGISLENLGDLDKIKNKHFVGIDVNSKFELSPANKDIEALKELFGKIKNT
ncbi:MAG: phosphoribosylanthranilate isomerase [Leadbetterella sp.]|nr:phosphoribosylanthranilate isomerase [Leadbetterella sp.]